MRVRRTLTAGAIGSGILTVLLIPALAQSPSQTRPPVNAQSQKQLPSPAGLDWVRNRFSREFNREPFEWSYIQIERRMGRIFDASNLSGGDFISQKDRDIADKISLAKNRARQMQFILSADIDGDNRVTRDEARIVLRHRYATRNVRNRDVRIQREFDRLFRFDRDRDGVITLAEVGRSVELTNSLRRTTSYRYRSSTVVPFSLDTNRDGKINREEFFQSVRLVFEEIDKDKNKRLSQPEMSEFMRTMYQVRRRLARQRRSSYTTSRIVRSMMRCNLPTVAKETQIVYAGAYRGKGLANVYFRGDRKLLTVAQVDIEAGTKPLALVLAAPANTVWQITGAKQRVKHVFVGSRFRLGKKPTIAVAGVDKDKVLFIGRSNCLPFDFKNDQVRAQVRKVLKTLMRGEPAALVSLGVAGKVAMPSGSKTAVGKNPQAVRLPTDSGGAPLWRAVAKLFPAGVVRFDVKQLVAQKPLVAGDVLPGRAGLAQLIDQGALELSANAGPSTQTSRFRGLARIDQVKIVAPVTMPIGLSNNVVRRFVLAKGVSPPRGLSGRLCVVDEASGKPVKGSGRCR